MQFFSALQYQPACKQLFEDYKNKILQLTPFAIVEHIGSSAIPNAISKGDLDIYVEVPAHHFLDTIEKLQQLNFKEKLDTLRTDQLCMLESQLHDVALQIVVTGSEFCNFLIFRDRLRNAPSLTEQYNQLKQRCIGFSQEQYREIKTEFIQSILALD
ncbi:hypothetical protein F909_02219 [Acinetobacter sp. ANC 3929]|uniref:GrpB family protein n=1 Tax=unclassified Acinetobacter TaxID=196816 RepID=UPI0002CE1363|nr:MULTISPECIES: GrpB family protein [unclassified Acinetobacter]ENW80929.1 hypothetical protein F909_02219 [Acinetobacter sp. ANC 3929]MCH7353078.1 GrpB family protein [Acinetobacter sp. NIPH 2023]MCH7356912.1 GrpB family protein [Acinetobacter sp. NIPH 1958]MCH7360379.1 GrpB family protein [Acinetobacter sp. NIPH 2024]